MNSSELSNEKLIKLQERIRLGKLKEEVLSEETYQNLKELYHKQIDKKKKSIEQKRQEIIKIRNLTKE